MTTTDDLNWDDLRYFLRAAGENLAGAARALGVEHSTIGRRLTALERALGAPLVLRNPDGLQLTPLGERVLPLVADIERGVLAIQDVVAHGQLRVRLAVPSGMTPFFTAALARMRAEHPHLSLEIVSGARPVDLKKGEADVALRVGTVTDGELIVRKLGQAGWALFASEHYLARRPAPTDLDDLTGHEVIAADPSMAALASARWMEERATRATIVLRSREMTDMLAAARSGLGLAVLPCSLGDSDPSLRRLSPVLGAADLSIVYRPEARHSPSLRAVVDFALDVVAEHGDLFAGRRPVPASPSPQ